MGEKRILFSLLWRSLFLQAVWNFERLQNIGFAFSLNSYLRRLYPDGEERREALLRHLAFFNTHPYMVSVILGLVASLEKDRADGKDVRVEEISAIKNNMAGPLAAIGDTFFWATWRPFVALLAAGIVLFLSRADNFSGTYLAPLVFLVAYNVVHLPFRLFTLKMGFQLRDRIVEIIARLEFHYAVDLVRFAGIVVLAILLVFYSWTFAGTIEDRIIFLTVLVITILSGFFRFSPAVIFYGVVLFGVAIGLMRG